jgi:hypothetical protein
MIVYHYDQITGAYLNTSSEADESPLEPGVFLIPAGATKLLPPSPPDPKKQVAVFRDGRWNVEDKPQEPVLKTNLDKAPLEGMWPRMSIKEALKGGVT